MKTILWFAALIAVASADDDRLVQFVEFAVRLFKSLMSYYTYSITLIQLATLKTVMFPGPNVRNSNSCLDQI